MSYRIIFLVVLVLGNAAAGCKSQREKAAPGSQESEAAGTPSPDREQSRDQAADAERGAAPTTQTPVADPQQQEIRFGPSTLLVPFEVSAGKVSRRPAKRIKDIVGNDRYTVAIVASWCPYSQDLLRGIALGKWYQPDLIVFDTDEVNRMKARPSRGDKGELNRPDALRFKLPYYFTPSAQIGEVEAYPLVLECNGKGCTEVSDSDS